MALRTPWEDGVAKNPREKARPTVASAVGDELGAASINRSVADALKRTRKLRELSLDQLAARSGVSRAALSQIESGRTNPTLSVLWKIAVGLDISFQELLELPDTPDARVLSAKDAVVLRSADGRVESRLVSPGGSASGVELYELRLSPKGLLRSEPHGKGTSETLFVLKGALRMVVGGNTYDLFAGDSIFFNADCPHEYENRGVHEVRLLDSIFYDQRR